MATDGPDTPVVLGVIVGAKGIRGEVRVKTFTEDPFSIGSYGPVRIAARPAPVKLTVTGSAKGLVTARLAGIDDRTTAETLRGQEISVARSALPDLNSDADGFYHTDLIGLAARTPDGEAIGTVSAVYDFGAGDLLEITPADGPAFMVPFTEADVPEVDIAGGAVTVVPPIYAPDDSEAEQTDG